MENNEKPINETSLRLSVPRGGIPTPDALNNGDAIHFEAEGEVVSIVLKDNQDTTVDRIINIKVSDIYQVKVLNDGK